MKLHWPIDPTYKVTQHFGETQLNYSQFGLNGHNGIDIACPRGTPLYAAHDGALEFYQEKSDTGLYKGYGINARIMLRDSDRLYELIYGHLLKYEGEARQVKAGDIIGYADSTGFSTGDHLHFGIREWGPNGVINYNNGYFGCFDPIPFLKGEDPMNQAKVVKSKNSNTVWVCYPMPSEEYLAQKAALEGFEVPAQMPDSDSLF